jgi:ribose transport system permease protein
MTAKTAEVRKKISPKDLLLKYNAVLILIVLVVASSLLSNVFFTTVNIFNLLRQITPLLLVSLGMLFVILTGGIDLSVGSIAAVCAMMMSVAIMQWKFDTVGGLVVALLLTCVVGFAIGSINGVLVAILRMAPFVATLATMTMGRGLAYLITNGQPLRLSPDFASTKILDTFGSKNIPVLSFPWPILLAIIVVVIFALVSRYMTFGRMIIATGSNESAVRLAGIPVQRYKFLAYAFCGLMCALAAIVSTSRTSIGTPISGTGYELDAIASCVIGGASLSGGKGTVLNTVIGVIILGLIGNIMNLLSVAAYPQQIIKGAIIIFAVLLQSVSDRRGNV